LWHGDTHWKIELLHILQEVSGISKTRNQLLLIIENVPVVSCPHCGTSYLTAQTLHEIDRIKRHRHELASQRPVAVAAFA
jgi:YgiT-type zinc finger domain-containing protein